MARPKKHPGTPTKSVTFFLPAAEVAAVDAHAEKMSQRFNIHMSRTDAFRNILAAGLAAMAAPNDGRLPESCVPEGAGGTDDAPPSPLIRVAMWRQSVAASGEDDGLSSVHVAILMMIAQYQGANDSSRVSQPKLAAAAGCARSSARDALADLMAGGWITARSTDGGVVHYALSLEQGRPIGARKASLARARGASAENAGRRS